MQSKPEDQQQQKTPKQHPKLPRPVRGDVFKARLDPTEGSEQAGTRSVIIVSRDSINTNSPVVVVVPTTDSENPKRIYPSQMFLPKGSGGLKIDSIAKAEQIRAIQISRFEEYWGRLNETQMAQLSKTIKDTLLLK